MERQLSTRSFLKVAGAGALAAALAAISSRKGSYPDNAARASTTPSGRGREQPTMLPTATRGPSGEVPATPTAPNEEVVTVFGTEEQFDHKKMGLVIEVPWLLDFHNEVTLVYYFAKDEAERQKLSAEVAPGLGTASTFVQADGSLMIVEHSGYTDKKKNPAEDLRRYLESSAGDNDVAGYTDGEVAGRMQALMKGRVSLIFEGLTRDCDVAYVQKMGYGTEINQFRQDGNVALETAKKLDRAKNKGISVLDNFKGPFVGINFCGWARSDQAEALKNSGAPTGDQWEYNGYLLWLVEK